MIFSFSLVSTLHVRAVICEAGVSRTIKTVLYLLLLLLVVVLKEAKEAFSETKYKEVQQGFENNNTKLAFDCGETTNQGKRCKTSTIESAQGNLLTGTKEIQDTGVGLPQRPVLGPLLFLVYITCYGTFPRKIR